MPYPSTGVLDDFNRANADVGANWTTFYSPPGPSFRVLSNQLAPPLTPAWTAMYYVGQLAPHECWATYSVASNADAHYCYLQLHPNLDQGALQDNYYVEMDSDYLGLGKTVNGSAALLTQLVGHDEAYVQDGDTFGLWIDGNDVVAWRNRPSVGGEELLRVTDTTHRATTMYRLMEIADIATEVRIDQFGGAASLTPKASRTRVKTPSVHRASSW